jgi:Uma2 family endonuclease
MKNLIQGKGPKMTASIVAPLITSTWTATDLANHFGPIPLSRIRFIPFPGTATEQDVLDVQQREHHLCELVNGVLVEKAMGLRESFLAIFLASALRGFVTPRKLGAVTGEAGLLRLAPGLVRIPDVSFFSWNRFPNRQIPSEPIPDIVPDLAVEVLSPSNTKEEMTRKLHDYFTAGCQLVWFVDPVARIVTVYTSPDQATVLNEDQTLDGGNVLPGFSLPLRQLFAELDPH